MALFMAKLISVNKKVCAVLQKALICWGQAGNPTMVLYVQLTYDSSEEGTIDQKHCYLEMYNMIFRENNNLRSILNFVRLFPP